MKLIYYHIYKAISKIEFDKMTEWKAISVLSLLLLFNILSVIKFFLVDYNSSIFSKVTSNKIIWLICFLTIFGILYFLYGTKERSSKIIKYYTTNKRFNTIWSKSITIGYIILTLVAVYIVTHYK